MIESPAEKLLTRILAGGAGVTTVLVVAGSVTDPVNAPKLFSLGITAFACIFLVLFSASKRVLLEYKLQVLVVLVFVLSALNSLIWSKAPTSQSFFGVYGRNNGFLTYFSLSMIFLCTLTLKMKKSYKKILIAFLISGYINLGYCFWVLQFGDFIGWTNPYGNILGTFGNPNFIGAFLGIFVSVYVAFAISKSTHRFYRIGAVVVIPLAFYEIIMSHAVQGRVVAAAGFGIVFFYFIRARFSKSILIIYVILSFALGILSLMGALQKGPLVEYIYKTSVSLRGQYWLSGWNAGIKHPLTGVGMDSLGDWYRRTRDSHALVLPGVDTVINASHNVILDMFAFGGLPLLISYILLIVFSFISIVKITLRTNEFDPIFVGLVVAWFGYQIQSIISINQIGLAIWGWMISGSLIALEKSSKSQHSHETKEFRIMTNTSAKDPNLHFTLVVSAGALVGALIAIPPLISDSKWRIAQVEQSLPKTLATMSGGFFNPQNTMKYGINIKTLESSQLFDLSHRYALEAVAWNPEVYDLWKTLYLLKNTTPAEKETALMNMKRLDPLNPNVTK
jgi:hypothetical protein